MSGLKSQVQGISRRSFLKTSAAAAGAMAVAGSAVPLQALAADDSLSNAVDEQDVVCVCGCNCQGNCSLVATVRE